MRFAKFKSREKKVFSNIEICERYINAILGKRKSIFDAKCRYNNQTQFIIREMGCNQANLRKLILKILRFYFLTKVCTNKVYNYNKYDLYIYLIFSLQKMKRNFEAIKLDDEDDEGLQ